MDYFLGCKRSPDDNRDWAYRKIYKAVPLPSKFSRRGEMTPIRDQGKFGTCTWFAGSGIKDWQESMDWKTQILTSPLFGYCESKKIDGIPNQEGSYPRIVMEVLTKKGVCLEKTFPYSKMSWPVLPSVPSQCYPEALKYKIGGYARISVLDELKQAIFQSGPCLAGIMVCDSFVKTSDGFIPIPGEGDILQDNILGGHALCVVGFDDNLTHGKYKGYLEVRNSWGPDWGDHGYCWIPYDFFNYKQDGDIQMTYWWETWSCVDIITPGPQAREIIFTLDSTLAIVDGVEIQMDVAPTVDPQAGRTLLPVRFLCEQLGCSVEWIEANRQIRIINNNVVGEVR